MATNSTVPSTTPIVIDPNAPDPHPVEHAITSTIRHSEHVLVKLLSVIMLILGLSELYETIVDIFIIYPQLPFYEEYQLVFNPTNQHFIRSLAMFIGLSLIKTLYGLSLLTRDKHLIHRIEVLTSIGVLLTSFIISHYVPQLDLKNQIPEIEHPSIESLLHW